MDRQDRDRTKQEYWLRKNQLSVATTSLRHQDVKLCGTDTNLEREGGCTSPVDGHKPLLSEYIPSYFHTCTSTGLAALGFPKAHGTLCSGIMKHSQTFLFGKLRATRVGKSSGADHS